MAANEKAAGVSALETLAKKLLEKVPVSVSQLTNDKEYQTAEQVTAAVAAGDHLVRKKVESLAAIDPNADGADKYIYMVPKADGADGDEYDEYMVMDGAVEHVGSWKVDLNGYVQKEAGKGLSSNDYTGAEKTKLAGVAEGASKVEASDTPGAIKINGVDTPVVEFATEGEVSAMLKRVFGS